MEHLGKKKRTVLISWIWIVVLNQIMIKFTRLLGARGMKACFRFPSDDEDS